jgi:hypothetical protein
MRPTHGTPRAHTRSHNTHTHAHLEGLSCTSSLPPPRAAAPPPPPPVAAAGVSVASALLMATNSASIATSMPACGASLGNASGVKVLGAGVKPGPCGAQE